MLGRIAVIVTGATVACPHCGSGVADNVGL
jgi:uncharacterized protein (DUF983 family)